MYRAIFFTEGSQKIGLGHISRCCALAEAFRRFLKGINVSFIIRGDETGVFFLKQHGFVSKVFDWQREREKVKILLEKKDLIIVDSYSAPLDFYHFLLDRSASLLVLDDFFRLPYPDQAFILNPMADPDGRKHHLFGLKYLLLRPSFWNIPKRITSKSIHKILIIMGGVDNTNFVPYLLDFLDRRYTNLEKIVVVANNKIFNAKYTKTKFFFSLSDREIFNIMLSCDLAISAGGQTLYELIRVGLPIISVITAKNQILNVKKLEQLNLIWNAGWFDSPKIWDNIICGIEFWYPYVRRKYMALIGPRIIDGCGAYRVVKILKNSLNN